MSGKVVSNWKHDPLKGKSQAAYPGSTDSTTYVFF